MSVELWIGQEFDTSHERRALHYFLREMNEHFSQSDDLYLILANYYLDGRQIDLTVLKNDAAIVIELKECSDPFRAAENGPWLTPDGTKIGTGEQNPFEQAKDYRFRLVNLLKQNQNKFLPPGKAQTMEFYHVSAFVVISPSLHPDIISNLPGPRAPWFRLVGLDQLSDAVYQQTSHKLNFSDQELRKLVAEVLNLKPTNALSGHVTPGNIVFNQIGRYKILESLGQGGMGTVYRAYDPSLDRQVVIKFITSSNSAFGGQARARFQREVQTVSQFNHPHIITIYDVSLEHDPPYVVMELLTGGTLEDRLKQKPLVWHEALILARLLAQALGYAHQTGVIHRDIKPANVMFAGDELNTLKLVDFGLAHWQDAEALTQVGVAIGTPAYMSPEQALGESIDHRTDIFALGIVLFEAITGYNPLKKGTPMSTLVEVASYTQLDTSLLTDKAPPEVIKLIERATAQGREQRYQSCEELLLAIDDCLGDLPGVSNVPAKNFLGNLPHPVPTIQKPQYTSHLAIEIEPPYGTMHPDSTFYIERTADEYCREALNQTQAVTLFIQAPRQMGKSSLMRRVIHRADKAYSRQSIFIDFQKFPRKYFIDEESLLIDLCVMISDALGIPEAIDHYWRGRRTHIRKCSLYVSKYIIPKINRPFILALDEVERMLDSPFRSDFFGMLRTWHNDRAYDESFAQMTLFLSSSTEPYLFIANPHRSPFNVAEVISLQDFTRKEVEELNRRHASPLDENQVTDLMKLVGGHPFLTRVALYQLAMGKIELNVLFTQATDENGPFGEHLRHYHHLISENPELKQALVHICRTHSYEDNQTFQRLKGAGLIRQVREQVILRNNLYARYFEEHLNE